MGLPVAFAGGLVSKASKIFRTPSHKRAQPIARDLVQRALAGDQAALAELKERAFNPRSPGKTQQVFRQALAQVEAGKTFETPPSSAFDLVFDPIREGAAEAIQRAAAGAGTIGARAVAPEGSRAAGAVNIPTDVTMLRNIAIGAAGIVLLVVVVVSIRR